MTAIYEPATETGGLIPLLFGAPPGAATRSDVDALLRSSHYLGPCRRAVLYLFSDAGAMVFAKPASRSLPSDGTWLELSRWCLLGAKNAGSTQWAQARTWLREHRPDVTTVVSYSDPGAGHTGALYRACNWLWAPTWHRLRPPPSGNGRWSDKVETVKDRWVFPLAPDAVRAGVLRVKDEAICKVMPWAEYVEPRWKYGRPLLATGGGDYKRWSGRA